MRALIVVKSATLSSLTSLFVATLLPGSEVRAAPPADASLSALAATAVAEDAAEASAAIASLRAAGPRGLDALLALLDPSAAGAAESTLAPAQQRAAEAKARHDRLHAAIDLVARQKDARFSRLYWHTDEAEAIARAEETKRPVLSLRLLGRLDEDCSCANSRFFRTALYPDPAVAAALRERFVLHWRSMRPVPKITIDFGDGRVVERPVTGNSAHLVLDAHGRVVDVIPGLLGPAAFVRALERAEAIARDTVDLDGQARIDRLGALHAQAVTALDDAWKADVAAIGLDGAKPETLDDPATWTAIAARHGDDARLSRASVAVMREKTNAMSVARIAVSKSRVEDPLVRIVARFEGGLAVDTVRNEQRLHRVIHRWFTQHERLGEPQGIAERVYAELFLTPSTDPWFGLVPPDDYAALDGGGVRVAATVIAVPPSGPRR